MDFYIWHESLHYVGSYCWQRARNALIQRNALRDESFLYMYKLYIICKNAKNAIYVQYTPELTLVTASPVGAVPLMMQILFQSSVHILCQSRVKC